MRSLSAPASTTGWPNIRIWQHIESRKSLHLDSDTPVELIVEQSWEEISEEARLKTAEDKAPNSVQHRRAHSRK
jgi:hypothetical protein